MTSITFLLLVAGLVLLVAGAEFLVRGASRIAAVLQISPLIIGLTIVAYGTSAPEMFVSVMSGLSGQGDIAMGNVVGSNICNVLLILGLSALVTPLVVTKQIIRSDVPIMIGVSVLLLMFCLDGKLSRVDSLILFTGAIAYTLSLMYQSKKQKTTQDEFTQEYGFDGNVTSGLWLKNIILIVGGLALLVLGSRWLVDSAVNIATALGVNELLIGLTIVAIGTSLPELATSVVASFRGERDIAVGNVLGSNIFNILAVLGVSGTISPDGIQVSETLIQFDLPVAIAVAFACLPIFYSGQRIDRWEALLFLFYYLAYTGYLVLDVTKQDTLPTYIDIMLWFVIPLTVITLVTISIREKRAAGKRRSL
ncbi:calcium/sodium antiporter [Waterburya agarophytonicola K14]|uniref:Calcium/sodium antiporter n=1 Tax=Waterburya agarophytonicola KI4 TaxID=2874699 RepID=A0A964BNK7_9CYAN|nr:calcium/sodium antiporter [Waterburya agarophytonicola]MCC0176394.1 calcium/sodium antiporter [Waterburya agarophytonicola KI4]